MDIWGRLRGFQQRHHLEVNREQRDGGVGGAVLGNAIKGGGLGLVAGAVGGGLLGREVGKSGCRRTTTAYRSSSSRNSAAPAPQTARRIYYDQRGNPVVTLIHPGTHKYPDEAPALIVKFFQEHRRPLPAASN